MFSTHIFGRAKPSDEENDKQVLRDALSLTSRPSTTIASCDVYQQEQCHASGYAQIGKGQCGTIFTLGTTNMVIKLPNSTSKYGELYNDFQIHRRVQEAFEQQMCDINIPSPRMWVDSKSDHFWADQCSLFDASIKTPNYGLVSEQICSIPASVRGAIVDSFRAKWTKEYLSADECCLIRLYLGRRNTALAPNVSLRNFPLHVDEMERLRLDIALYTRIVAKSLAIMHWKAGVDANDVEFVLGGSPRISGQPSPEQLESHTKETAASLYCSDFQRRTISMWLLDFNLCKRFEMNNAGLEQLVKGFWWNNPYYPRPNATDPGDQELWRVFRQQYLESSSELTNSGMPDAFIEAVIAEGRKRSGDNMFA